MRLCFSYCYALWVGHGGGQEYFVGGTEYFLTQLIKRLIMAGDPLLVMLPLISKF